MDRQTQDSKLEHAAQDAGEKFSWRIGPGPQDLRRMADAKETGLAYQASFEFADQVPFALWRTGLRAANPQPKASIERDDPDAPRMTPAQAWAHPYAEIARTGSAYSSIALRITPRRGGASAAARIEYEVKTGAIPRPNIAAIDIETGEGLAMLHLADPVRYAEPRRRRPIEMLTRITEHLAQVLGADSQFNGVLVLNPAQAESELAQYLPEKGRRRIKRAEGRRTPYKLRELAEMLPRRCRRLTAPATAPGRNRAAFDALCAWAGAPENYQLGTAALRTKITEIGRRYRLPEDECAGIRASIERYREKWSFGPDAWNPNAKSKPYTHTEALQRFRQGKQAEARRKANKDRDAAIVRAIIEGQSEREISKALDIARSTVENVLRRSAPLLMHVERRQAGRPGHGQPWIEQAISRATWFRRQAASQE